MTAQPRELHGMKRYVHEFVDDWAAFPSALREGEPWAVALVFALVGATFILWPP